MTHSLLTLLPPLCLRIKPAELEHKARQLVLMKVSLEIQIYFRMSMQVDRSALVIASRFCHSLGRARMPNNTRCTPSTLWPPLYLRV